MKKAMLMVAALICLAGRTEASQIIVNGDFETGGTVRGIDWGIRLDNLTWGRWDVYTSIPGWYTVAGPGIEIEANGVTVRPQSGSHFVELDSNANSAMRQGLTLSSLKSYELSFWYQPRTNAANDNQIIVSVGQASSGLNKMVITVDGTFSAFGGWRQYRVVLDPFLGFVKSTATAAYVQFAAGGRSNSYGGFIDNIQINESAKVASGATPEPATLSYLGLGLLGMMTFRRRIMGRSHRQRLRDESNLMLPLTPGARNWEETS